jgi:polyferredoxin
VLGVFNLFRIFGIRRNAPTCTNCKACDRACPMNIPVSTTPGRVRDHQCIACLECTSEKACPEKDTVIFGIGAPSAPVAAGSAPAKEATP